MERPHVKPEDRPLPFSSGRSVRPPPLEDGVDGRGGALRRRVNLIFAGCAGAQSRMTVLRREVSLSRSASPRGEAPLSLS